MTPLFEPFASRSVSLRNRVVVAPMCQYSAGDDGRATDWHFVHYGSRAVGGAGLVLVEATAVEARGRLSEADLGLWEDAQLAPLARVARFMDAHGAVPGVQLAHGGRKGFSNVKAHGPEPVVGPSALAFDDGWRAPEVLDEAGIEGVIASFRAAARRAREAGFRVVEIHAAHGYLIHEFLSPLSNRREDAWGGALEGRARLLRRVVAAVREVWPAELPLWVRLSCSDWAPGGLTVEDCAAALAGLERAVDVVHCSSGGNVATASIPAAPGYQVPFAAALKRAGWRTCAVGLLTEPAQCEAVLASGDADLVAIGREELRDPYFPLRAATALGAEVGYWPKPYLRAKP
jgi:2,4-dienoyl-CoA reductase-like NADH-dependent reductase (Old Yellow Enzyme family)